MGKIYQLLVMIFVLCYVNFAFAQSDNVSLPSEIQNILNQNFPKWKLVKNVCTTAISGDFNADMKIDYITIINFQNGGRVVGFISDGDEFLPIVVQSLTKQEAQISTVNLIPKSESISLGKIGDENQPTMTLKTDGFYSGICQSDDGTFYIFQNNIFTALGNKRSANSANKDNQSNNKQNNDEFIVKGSKPWLDTGINVSAGCLVILLPQGKVDVSAGWGSHDARGTDKFYVNNNYPVNSKMRYGLAAQITSGSIFREINRDAWIYEYEGTHVARKSGRLWLVVNDDNPQDNKGEFRVRVRINCDGAN